MPRRNAASCRIEWVQHGHPGINSRKWTKKEQETLYKIVERHGQKNWPEIAQELNVSDDEEIPTGCAKQGGLT